MAPNIAPATPPMISPATESEDEPLFEWLPDRAEPLWWLLCALRPEALLELSRLLALSGRWASSKVPCAQPARSERRRAAAVRARACERCAIDRQGMLFVSSCGTQPYARESRPAFRAVVTARREGAPAYSARICPGGRARDRRAPCEARIGRAALAREAGDAEESPLAPQAAQRCIAGERHDRAGQPLDGGEQLAAGDDRTFKRRSGSDNENSVPSARRRSRASGLLGQSDHRARARKVDEKAVARDAADVRATRWFGRGARWLR